MKHMNQNELPYIVKVIADDASKLTSKWAMLLAREEVDSWNSFPCNRSKAERAELLRWIDANAPYINVDAELAFGMQQEKATGNGGLFHCSRNSRSACRII